MRSQYAVTKALTTNKKEDRLRDIGMFIADPFNRNFYQRIVIWGVVIAACVLFWRSLGILGKSARRHDIRQKNVGTGFIYSSSPVGENNPD